ncbi:MAG: AAA family ATPase [Leptolyngbyaceae cyanobacterium bins.302]|nr:AAA family ATPase [Leptolyngbyaceae cyanobacterium bins.302]
MPDSNPGSTTIDVPSGGASSDPPTATSLQFALTEQQADAIEKLQAFVQPNCLEKLLLIAGFPGVGKSTIMVYAIQELQSPNLEFVLTATTNKAVNVLSKMATRVGLQVPCMTIHQFLGLKLVKRQGQKVLEKGASDFALLTYFSGKQVIVFVDECSMINKALWSFLTQETARFYLAPKFVLMGDPFQLNPVNEGRSPSFKVTNKVILNQIVRQAAHNPLLTTLEDCRLAIRQKVPFAPKTNSTTDKDQGLLKTSQKTLVKYAQKSVVESFDTNPDRFRILCWTNKRVDFYNTLLRRHRYGQDAPRFVVDERLISTQSIVAPNKKDIILNTATEMLVTGVEEQPYEGYRAYRLTVLPEGYPGARQIFVLHEAERERFDQETEHLLQSAKRSPVLWRKYYEHLEIFAQVRPCFALTVHTSQGSTFEEVAIDADDLRKRLRDGTGESLTEYNRLWMVALSRAQRRVLFCCDEG